MGSFKVLCICSFLFSFVRTLNSSLDNLSPSHSIRDKNNETLVSPNGRFELGFFSPRQQKNRYVGIWYKNIAPRTVVWVANRETPVTDTSGVLELNEQGLVLFDGTNSTIWSSSSSFSEVSENTIAHLQDSGNLVVQNGHDNIVWQSFDHPTDTLLPEMKLGSNQVTGLDTFLSSWKSQDDPAQGEFVIKIDPTGYPQLVLLNGSKIIVRGGSWNGLTFTGFPYTDLDSNHVPEFMFDKNEVYFDFKINGSQVLIRYIINHLGIGQRLDWNVNQAKEWHTVTTGPPEECDNYAFCGTYSVCNRSHIPVCECLKGFVQRSPQEWSMGNWSTGCARNNTLAHNNSDGFLTYTNLKLPDTSSSLADDKTMSIEDCKKKCLGDSNCTAYATLDIRTRSGCLLWFGDLIDMRVYPSPAGQDLYVKVAALDLDHVDFDPGKHRKRLVGGIAAVSTATIMFIIFLGLYLWKAKPQMPGIPKALMARSKGSRKILHQTLYYDKLKKEGVDLPTFDLSTIAKATNDFSISNKIGQGGFGPVYKGILPDGQEVAIKRLSKNSVQGPEEFVNELLSIAKLQHRNLVKLLGCCVQGEEKMLIYEYLPNKSLNCFIFDESRSRLLSWPVRFHIIDGVARGLLYLHHDSILKIIHRDVKTSNILLDTNMNPKISDFGMARIFKGDQVEANTNNLVGTHGYISPEYLFHGKFLTKSDVFSFGVLVLEIISGKKNKISLDLERQDLLGHAWRLWTLKRPLELLDKGVRESCREYEVMRCIQLGLLCVQQKPEDRPNMSSVVLMLNGEKLLPKPKLPGFYFGRQRPEGDYSSGRSRLLSVNEVPLTILEPR